MTRDDEGSVLLLGIGWLVTCVLALVVMIDISAVFLQRQQLQATADAAALAGAQGIDVGAYYRDGASAQTRLDPATVSQRITAHLQGSRAATVHPGLAVTSAATDGVSVRVAMSRSLTLPILPPLISLDSPRISVESTAHLAYRDVQ